MLIERSIWLNTTLVYWDSNSYDACSTKRRCKLFTSFGTLHDFNALDLHANALSEHMTVSAQSRGW